MNRRLAGLAGVAALLGGYLAVDHLGSIREARMEAPVAGAAGERIAAVKINPLQDLDPEAYTAIVERPLFNPSRLPRPAEVVAPPPPVVEPPPPEEPPPPPPQGPAPEDYKLLGVASGPDGRIAALRIAASGDVVYLRKGESVDNWTVVDVGERSVAIGTPENAVTFALFASEGGGDGAVDQTAPAMEQQSQPLPLPLPMPQPTQPVMPDTGG